MDKPPVNPEPGQMAPTEDESAYVKQYLRSDISPEERARVEAEYPLEADEVADEDTGLR